MANIFSLFGEVLIDNTNANKSIDTTTQKAEQSGSKIGSAFSTIVKGAAAVGTAVVTGAVAVGSGIYKMVNNTADAADEIDKMSQKLGLSREAYQEWDYVLSQSGVDINSLSTGMQNLTDKFDDAKNGSAGALSMFEKVGLSLKDLNSMSREDVFNAVIAGMQGMEDDSERAALANDLLGRSGKDLAALFNQTAESTEDLKNKAHELGLVMSDDAVNGGVKLKDTIDTTKRSFSAVLYQLGSALLPVVQNFLNFILDAMPTVQGIISDFSPMLVSLGETLSPLLQRFSSEILPKIFSLISRLAPLVNMLISEILPIVINVLDVLLPVIIQLADELLPVIMQVLVSLLPAIKSIFELLGPVLELIMLLLEPLIRLIQIVLPVLADWISKIVSFIAGALKGAIEWIIGKFKDLKSALNEGKEWIQSFKQKWVDIWTSVKTFFGNLWSNLMESPGVKKIKEVIDKIREWILGFKQSWEASWNGIKSFFTDTWNGIKEGLKLPLNWIIDKLNDFIRWINQLQVPDWVPVVGGKGFNFREIPRLRIGMDYVPHDDFPALLHKGERVLTQSENRAYSAQRDGSDRKEQPENITVNIRLGERAVWIERLDGVDRDNVDGFIDELMERIADKIKREGAVFA